MLYVLIHDIGIIKVFDVYTKNVTELILYCIK